MVRKFKPGDWVKIKGNSDSQKMEVLKYVSRKNTFGLMDNDSYLECIWYKNGERKAEVFHQNKLIRLIETGGLYKV